MRKIAIDSSGNVYTAGKDNKVHKIDSSGNTVWTSITFSSDMLNVAVNPAGGAAVSQVNGSEAVLGFGLSNNDIQWTYTGRPNEVLDTAYDRNENLFTANEDRTIQQLNATNGQFIQSFELGSPVFGVAVPQDSPAPLKKENL